MQKSYKCPQCGKDVIYITNPCPNCKLRLDWSQKPPVPYVPSSEAPGQPVVQPPAGASKQPIYPAMEKAPQRMDSVYSTKRALEMTYGEVIAACKAKKVFISVNRSKAVEVMDKPILPNRYRVAHHFWAWVAILLIPIAIALAIFVQWWVGVIVLIVDIVIVFPSIQKSAAEMVEEYALEDEAFFEFAISAGLIRVVPKE